VDCAGERGSSIQAGGIIPDHPLQLLSPRTEIGRLLRPPDAHFESGVRYAIVLKGRESDLHTAIPLYQMEVQLSPQSPSQPQPPPLAAVRVSPRTVARSSVGTRDCRKVSDSHLQLG